MHKLFVPNDGKVHKVYEYNTISRTWTSYEFKCEYGEPDNKDLEVYFTSKSACIDYTYVTSMSTCIFEIIGTLENYPKGENNYYYDTFRKFIDAIFILSETLCDDIVIADYPDKLVFKLPLIKEFKKYVDEFIASPYIEESVKNKVKYSESDNRIDITMTTDNLLTEYFSDKYITLHNLITTYATILKKSFCKKTVIVNTDTFDIIHDNYTDMPVCKGEISFSPVDEKEFAKNEAEIDAPLVPALSIANEVVGPFGGQTKFSCCGHSYDSFAGYILFEFKPINMYDLGQDYFVELSEKASEEYPELQEYFHAEMNGNRITFRFRCEKALKLAATLEPEKVVDDFLGKFIFMMQYIEDHMDISRIAVPI